MKAHNFLFSILYNPRQNRSLACTLSFRIKATILFLVLIILGAQPIFCQSASPSLKLFEEVATSIDFTNLQHPEHTTTIPATETTIQGLYEAALKKNDPVSLASTALQLGLIQLKKGDTGKSSLLFTKALDAAKKSKDDAATCLALTQLGVLSLEKKDYAHALVFLNQSSAFIENLKSQKFSGFINALLGECYLKLNDAPLATESFIRASKAYMTISDKSAAAGCYNALGEFHLRQDDQKEAIASFSSAFNLLNTGKSNNLKALVLRNIGLFHFKQGDFEIALNYFNKSLANDNKLLVQKLIKDAYLQLFAYYSFSKDFTKADFYHSQYRALKDAIDKTESSGAKPSITDNEEKQAVIEMLQKKPEEQSLQMSQHQLELSKMITRSDIELQNKNQQLEEKDSTVHHLEDEKTSRERDFYKQELQLNKQKNFKNLLLALSVAALFLVVLLYNRYKIKFNSHQRLEQSNNELQQALTQLKQAQGQLIESEKMASLGQLTAGIAHEIQNPLNFVNNFSETSMEMMDEFLQAKDDQERAGLADEIQQALKKIHHHGKRADQIVKNMLLHSRTRSLEKESVQLNQLSTEMSDLAYHGTRAIDPGFRCKIEYRLDENLPQVSVNKQDIGRVLLNIFSNSFYALSKKRSMDSSGSFQAELLVETFKKENNLLIHIRDNGVGIPKKIQQHIFEPFFTTKPTGEGTGLGLSLSYDIITKDHQGKIEIESEEGVFTEFRITLPLST